MSVRGYDPVGVQNIDCLWKKSYHWVNKTDTAFCEAKVAAYFVFKILLVCEKSYCWISERHIVFCKLELGRQLVFRILHVWEKWYSWISKRRIAGIRHISIHPVRRLTKIFSVWFQKKTKRKEMQRNKIKKNGGHTKDRA